MSESTQRNRAEQEQLYGESLGVLFRRIADTLGLTQARLAETVGLSPAMLSQLMNAQRVKIGNPAVLARVRALDELAAEVAEQGAPLAQINSRVAQVRDEPVTTGTARIIAASNSTTTRNGVAAPTTRSSARSVQDLLRAVASAEEVSAAAAALEADHPGIAEVLRIYGTGRTEEAVSHYGRVVEAG